MRAEFLTVQGRTVRILRAGSGAPVLMIHGLGTMAERWMDNIEPLSKRFEVIVPDLFNHGFSQDFPENVSDPQGRHVDQVAGLIDVLGLAPCTVVGSSYGGLIAGLLTLKRPGLVKKLVIVGSGSALHPIDNQVPVLHAARDNAMKAAQLGTLDALRARLLAITHKKDIDQSSVLQGLLTANALPGRVASIGAFFDAMFAGAIKPEYQIYPRLDDISVPTLIVTGRNDIRASWEKAEEAARRIPECRIEIFDECGHAPMSEHKDRFNAVLTEFIDS